MADDEFRGVLRQQLDLEVALQFGKARLQFGALFFRHRAHVGIARRIGDQRFRVFELLLGLAIRLHRCDDRRQFGMFLGELHIACAATALRKLRLHRMKAVQQAFKGGGGNHGQGIDECRGGHSTGMVLHKSARSDIQPAELPPGSMA